MALISFDLDGVLQHSPFRFYAPNGLMGCIKTELAPYLGMSDLEAAKATILETIEQEHRQLLHAGHIVEAYDWQTIIARYAKRVGYSGELNAAEIMTRLCEDQTLCEAYPGARECLQRLADRGHRLVAITNGYRQYQEPVLRKLDLLGFFEALITPDSAGEAKPQTGIFRAAEAFGDGAPGVHIGDVLPHDIAGAKRAGWRAIYVAQAGTPGGPAMPPEIAALPPLERPAQAEAWLQARLERERRFHGWPPAELPECMPDAIVNSLSEIPQIL